SVCGNNANVAAFDTNASCPGTQTSTGNSAGTGNSLVEASPNTQAGACGNNANVASFGTTANCSGDQSTGAGGGGSGGTPPETGGTPPGDGGGGSGGSGSTPPDTGSTPPDTGGTAPGDGGGGSAGTGGTAPGSGSNGPLHDSGLVADNPAVLASVVVSDGVPTAAGAASAISPTAALAFTGARTDIVSVFALCVLALGLLLTRAARRKQSLR